MPTEPDSPAVDVTTSNCVMTVTLSSPSNRNALSRRLVVGLDNAFEQAATTIAGDPDSLRAVVLTHVAPVFCAGADLKERAGGSRDSGSFVDVLTRIMDLPVPVIAAVKGPVRAGGIGLMASCDLVVVRGDVQFALTEVRLGLAPAVIAVPILRRVPGKQLATAFLTGNAFDADEALRVGLVSHVASDDDAVDATVASLCGDVMLGSPRAVAATKAILRDVPGTDRDTAFGTMSALSNELFSSDDGREGMASFAERRPPRWQT
ncbi:MAG: enoyl-CoA hydratase-related protein [Actinomycetota bacterium]|nr:enoyl-CoA hydratase-related protein [Actinomycetota bacterium]